MANALLDFVMSLVRDPAAAARYAADPAQAIADADLTDVTRADVQNLIPVVAESLSMAAPSAGLDTFGAGPAGNVWASGAATAAFDAFADYMPEAPVPDSYSVVTGIRDVIDVLDAPDSALDALPGADLFDAASLQPDDPGVDPAVQENGAAEPGIADDWVSPVADPENGDRTPGFDIFD